MQSKKTQESDDFRIDLTGSINWEFSESGSVDPGGGTGQGGFDQGINQSYFNSANNSLQNINLGPKTFRSQFDQNSYRDQYSTREINTGKNSKRNGAAAVNFEDIDNDKQQQDTSSYKRGQRSDRKLFDNASTYSENNPHKKRSTMKTLQISSLSNTMHINYNSDDIKKRLNQKSKKIKHFTQLVLIFQYYSKFINLFLNSGRFQVKKLNDLQVNALGDLAHDQESYNLSQKQRLKKSKRSISYTPLYVKCQQFIIKKATFFPLIRPNLMWKMLFDLYQGYLVLFRMYFTTIKYVFFIYNIVASVDIIKSYTLFIINASFLIDMWMSLHTGYYDNGIMVMDRKKIALRYLKGPFIYDMIVEIPMILAFFIDKTVGYRIILAGFILESLIFIKWLSLRDLIKRTERVVTESEIGALWWPLLSLITKLLILAHIVGCIYFYLALLQSKVYNDKNNWVDMMDESVLLDDGEGGKRNLFDEGWFQQYLHSIFWAFSVMVSNILNIPKSKIELGFSCLIIITMTGVIGYVINTIGIILDDIEKNNKQFRLERERTNRFLKRRFISEKLRERVTLYIDYIQKYEKQRNFKEEQMVLDRMPPQLRKELLGEINQKKIKMFHPITDNFSESVINEVLLDIDSSMYSPGDIIFEEGQNDEGEQCIYLVYKGTIELFHSYQNGNESVVGVLKRGDIFGEIEFFTGQKHSYGARSGEASSVLKIRRDDLLRILRKYPKDYEIFKMIQEKILFNVYYLNKESVNQKLLKIGNNDQQSQKLIKDGENFKLVEDTDPYTVLRNQDKTRICQIHCHLCEQKGHTGKQCHRLHLSINVKQLIYDYNTYDIQIKRVDDFKRTDQKSHDALYDLEEIQQCAEDLFQFDEELAKEMFHLQHMYEQLVHDEEDLENSLNNYQQLIKNQEEKKVINKERRASRQFSAAVHGLNLLTSMNPDISRRLERKSTQNKQNSKEIGGQHLQTIEDASSMNSSMKRQSYRNNNINDLDSYGNYKKDYFAVSPNSNNNNNNNNNSNNGYNINIQRSKKESEIMRSYIQETIEDVPHQNQTQLEALNMIRKSNNRMGSSSMNPLFPQLDNVREKTASNDTSDNPRQRQLSNISAMNSSNSKLKPSTLQHMFYKQSTLNNSLPKDNNQRPSNVHQHEHLISKLQNDRKIVNYREFFNQDVDLRGFDKIQEYSIYWTQYNYSSLALNKNWNKYFQKEKDFDTKQSHQDDKGDFFTRRGSGLQNSRIIERDSPQLSKRQQTRVTKKDFSDNQLELSSFQKLNYEVMNSSPRKLRDSSVNIRNKTVKLNKQQQQQQGQNGTSYKQRKTMHYQTSTNKNNEKSSSRIQQPDMESDVRDIQLENSLHFNNNTNTINDKIQNDQLQLQKKNSAQNSANNV